MKDKKTVYFEFECECGQRFRGYAEGDKVECVCGEHYIASPKGIVRTRNNTKRGLLYVDSP